MPKFMQPETALARLAEDDHAPVMARVQALQQLVHPPLCVTRRTAIAAERRRCRVRGLRRASVWSPARCFSPCTWKCPIPTLSRMPNAPCA